MEVDDVFRRITFGNNANDESITSAFVALGLILNYLDRKNEKRVIPDILEAEILQGSDWSAARYPRTNQFQKELRRLFGSKPRQVDLWGKQFATKFNQGWSNLYWAKEIFVRCTYGGFGKDKVWELITGETAENRPVMVIMRQVSINSKSLRFYVMAACGYREGTKGKREIMVHSGKYGEQHVRGSRAQLMYVPIDQAICAYKFNVLVDPNHISKVFG
jgi:hypothetical protein